MKKWSAIIALIVVLGIALTKGLSAVVPVVMPLQLSLSQPDGQPLNENKTMVVTLYSDTLKQSWSEKHLWVPVQDGIATVYLGSVTPLSHEILDVSSPNLHVSIDSEDIPAIPLATVAYAFKAQSAEHVLWSNIAGKPDWSTSKVSFKNIYVSENIGIGVQNPAAALDIKGSAIVSGTIVVPTINVQTIIVDGRRLSDYISSVNVDQAGIAQRAVKVDWRGIEHVPDSVNVTYNAGSGLLLSGTTFSLASNIPTVNVMGKLSGKTASFNRFIGDGASLTGVNAESLRDNRITSVKVVNGSLLSEDLSTGNFTSITGLGTLVTQLKGSSASFSGIVTANKFSGNGSGLSSVKAESVVDNAISTSKILDGTLTNADFATGNFTAITGVGHLTMRLSGDTAQFLGTVTANKFVGNGSGLSNLVVDTLPDNIVTSQIIQNNTIQSVDIADNAVTTAKIKDGNITSSKIAPSAVTSTRVASGALMNIHLTTGNYTAITGLGQLTTPLLGGVAIFSGTVTANKFVGNGSELTHVIAETVQAGAISNDQIQPGIYTHITGLSPDTPLTITPPSDTDPVINIPVEPATGKSVDNSTTTTSQKVGALKLLINGQTYYIRLYDSPN